MNQDPGSVMRELAAFLGEDPNRLAASVRDDVIKADWFTKRHQVSLAIVVVIQRSEQQD